MELFLSTLNQTLLLLPFVLGITISFRVLNAADLTMDSSYVLGAAVFARLITLDVSYGIAVMGSILAGSCAGLLTASIQRRNHIDPLLSGVIAAFMLSSAALILMGKPNINLLSYLPNFPLYFSDPWSNRLCLIALSLLACSYFIFLLSGRHGLLLRAFGDAPLLFARLGFPAEVFRMLGFMSANALAAFSGLVTAHQVGYADLNMGLGMTLTGIGAVILGREIMQKIFFRSSTPRVFHELTAAFIGVYVYFLLLNALLYFGLNTLYLKLVLGLLLIFFLKTAARRQAMVVEVTS